MYPDKGKVVAVIPARGGSKRLPRKNILPLDGVPLLARVIRTAREAGVFDEIIVSSEDEEVLKLADREGALGHVRPEELATDRSTVAETCVDVLKSYESDVFCCIYATAALLTDETLRLSAREFLNNSKASVLMGVSSYNFHPVQAIKIDSEGFANPLFPDYQRVQSQFYPEVRVSNGTFYWARTRIFLEEKTFYGDALKTYDVSEEEVCDIDTFEDFLRLEKLYRKGL